MKNLYNKDHYVRIIYRFQKLKPEATALWGKMSVNQMLRHCADLLRIVNNPDRKDYPSNLFLKTIGRFVFLHTPLTWPKNLPTEPSINQAIVNSASNDFKDRKSTRLNSSHVSESRMPSSA